MADGEIRVTLDDATVQRLEAVAEAAGQTVDAYVRDLITARLTPDDDLAEDLAILEEYDRTGVGNSVEEAMAIFDEAVKRQLNRG